MKFCTKCGGQLPDEAHFCTVCGESQSGVTASPTASTTLTGAVAASQPSTSPAPVLPPKKKLSGCAIAAVIGGALVALGLAFVMALWFLVGSMTADAVKAAEDYLAVFKRGQTREAYEISASGLRKETSLSQFNKVVSQFPILTRHTAFNIKSRNVQNDAGSITGELIDSSGQKAEVEFTLIKEQGVWRVLMLHVKMIASLPPGSHESRLVMGLKPSGEAPC